MALAGEAQDPNPWTPQAANGDYKDDGGVGTGTGWNGYNGDRRRLPVNEPLQEEKEEELLILLVLASSLEQTGRRTRKTPGGSPS